MSTAQCEVAAWNGLRTPARPRCTRRARARGHGSEGAPPHPLTTPLVGDTCLAISLAGGGFHRFIFSTFFPAKKSVQKGGGIRSSRRLLFSTKFRAPRADCVRKLERGRANIVTTENSSAIDRAPDARSKSVEFSGVTIMVFIRYT